jgi:hemolysin III
MNVNTTLEKVVATVPFRTLREEIANAITHGFGALLAVAGLVLLALRAQGILGGYNGGTLTVTAFVLFAATMLTMFLCSTLYHAIQNAGAKRVFKILDHAAIYLFIAGTYTPMTLVVLPPGIGRILFCLEWLCAIAGIVLHATQCRFMKKAEIIVYLVMGWAIIAAIPYLRQSMSALSIIFLAAGGLSYTLGVFWYAKKRKHGAHVVWHVFVLGGAVCHWWSVWFMA